MKNCLTQLPHLIWNNNRGLHSLHPFAVELISFRDIRSRFHIVLSAYHFMHTS